MTAEGITFALFVSRTGALGIQSATTTRYLHHDHLGSVAAIADETCAVVERLAYDPWGKRRNPNGTSDVLDALVGQNTDRGYTMHEHLDEVGAIHMNGRIYDPLIGRFMSADPFIQAPDNLQSHNRYAYVLNNPLSHTDPSGYFSLKKFLRTVVSVVVAYYTGGWVEAASGSVVAGGAAGGFVAGAVSTGTFTGAVQGAFGGALFGAAGLAGGPGELGANSLARYAAHATAGCVSSAAFGGNCSSGATSALFGKFASNQIAGMGGDDVGGDIARGVASAIAGDVGSVMGGGNFENGAMTAAFGYLFNATMEEWKKAVQTIGIDGQPINKGSIEVGIPLMGGGSRGATGPAIDRATGRKIGRVVVDSKGNAMIEPVGGRTISAGKGGVDTHTLYPNGSNYQRLNPEGHASNSTPHGHGHLPGTGPGMKGQGASIDVRGNAVPWNSPAAHWPIN